MTVPSLSKVGYVVDIGAATIANSYFREVLFTGAHSQLVLMSLKPGEEIGMEVHPNVDQFFRIEKGNGKVVMNEEETEFHAEYAFIVPAGTNHNIINTSDSEDLKLYTIYSPANHPAGTIHKTKEDAMAAEKEEHKSE
jgi:mannose-6-phosphate isomerase-like protein (cupin superfamily)